MNKYMVRVKQFKTYTEDMVLEYGSQTEAVDAMSVIMAGAPEGYKTTATMTVTFETDKTESKEEAS